MLCRHIVSVRCMYVCRSDMSDAFMQIWSLGYIRRSDRSNVGRSDLTDECMYADLVCSMYVRRNIVYCPLYYADLIWYVRYMYANLLCPVYAALLVRSLGPWYSESCLAITTSHKISLEIKCLRPRRIHIASCHAIAMYHRISHAPGVILIKYSKQYRPRVGSVWIEHTRIKILHIHDSA